MGGFGAPTMMQPQELSDGNLFFPSPGDIFIIEPSGSVRYHKAMPSCRWLRTAVFERRLRFACESEVADASIRVVEYDASLNIKSSLYFHGKNTGFPLLSEFSDGKFLSLINKSNSTGPLATLFDAQGKILGELAIPSGGLEDGISENIGSGAVILVTDEKDDHFVPRLYWLKY